MITAQGGGFRCCGLMLRGLGATKPQSFATSKCLHSRRGLQAACLRQSSSMQQCSPGMCALRMPLQRLPAGSNPSCSCISLVGHRRTCHSISHRQCAAVGVGRSQHRHAIRAQSAGCAAVSTSDGNSGRLHALLYSKYDKEIFSLAIPALFSVLLDPLLSLVDTAIVGRLGTAPLGAVGLATLVFNFSNFLFSFLMVVTTPRVAAAAANDNPKEASRVTAQGLQVALVLGCMMAVFIWHSAPWLVARMQAHGEVAQYATTYLRCRCIASPAVLVINVAIGSFRGFRDTVTPLLAAMAANLINLTLDIILIFGCGMGVAGAALATSASQYVSMAVLLAMLVRRNMLAVPDLLRPPPRSELIMFLKSGVSVSSRNITSMAIILYATVSVNNLGPVSLAAHEILRQVWIFAIQAFSALDIATQTLVATYLGQHIQHKAFQVLKRTLQLGVIIGIVIGMGMTVGRATLPGAFTSDPDVISIAQRLFPVLALYLPFDAAASILDGSLLGAADTNYLGQTMLATGIVSFAALYYVQTRRLDLMAVWLSIKCLTLGRVLFGALRIFGASSPLLLRPKIFDSDEYSE